ncbi:MAG: beta-ketoacyl-[acyl-carrier-protein] synthase family protein [Myxococcota bacterium]
MTAVAIAGVGIVSGLGRTCDQVCDALRAHRTGQARVARWSAAGLPTDVAVQVPGHVPDLADFPDDRKVALLMQAADQALVGAPEVASDRRGVFLGTGLSSVTPRELAEDVYPYVVDGGVDQARACADRSQNRVAPRRHLPSRGTAALARHWNATGPGGTSFSACAASAEAIAAGMRAIQRGHADVVLVGGHDAMIHPLGMLSFQALGALSTTTARPFDVSRDGFILGEGAAVLRLERLDRCATPLALVLGAGSSLDASGVTAPHPQGRGAEQAMRRALRDAGRSASDVTWVNAHATATPVGDRAEARAIARLFGPTVPVSSLKGAFGHGLAAAGALETVATVLAFNHGFTPGTVGCQTPDPSLDIQVLMQPQGRPPGLTISNSFGFGGQNVSVVLAPVGAPWSA